MESAIYEMICRRAEALEDKLTAYRRDFHTYAESGWNEYRTSAVVARSLQDLGYEVLMGRDVCRADARMGLPTDETMEREYRRAREQGADPARTAAMRGGFTGVIGILDCGEGPTIAMRFDIDALGVYESNAPEHRPAREGFRSVNEGVMHACGHDGHTAIGLGVAEVLMGLRQQLRGKIKLIFQPAEEGVRGAAAIVAAGHLDDVDYVIGNHMGNGTGDGQIGLTWRATLATTKLDVTFRGRAAHAAMVPEQGSNAMLAAATAVLNLHAIPRCSTGDTRINVGTLRAGSGRNVICDRAVLEMEVRGATTETNDFVEQYARRIVESAAAMHGCTCEIRRMGAAESLQSHPDFVRYAQRVLTEKLGLRIPPVSEKAGASEDFAAMVNRVQSHGGKGLAFTTFAPCSGPFHGKNFDFPETVLPNAVKAFCGLTCSLMEEPF